MADNTIATAYVQLTASAKGLSDDISKELGGSGSSEGSNFGATFIKGAGAAIAAGAAAVTATVASLWNSATDAAAAGDEIAKSSVKLGVTTEQYQALAFAAEHCDFEMSNLMTAQRSLMNSGFEGSIYDAVNAIMELDSETERTALASELFGDRATIAMANLLNGTDSLDEFKTQLESLGGMMSEDTVKNSAKFEDAMTNVEASLNGLKTQMVGSFLPGITLMMDGFASFIGGDNRGLGQMEKGISVFIANLNEKLPTFIEFAGNMVLTLAKGIITHLPKLIDSAFEVIKKLATELISNLPMIAQSAVQIILSLVKGMTSTLPALIPVAVDAIITLAKGLVEPKCLMEIISAALTLIEGLAKGLIEAIPVLLEAIPEIVGSLLASIIASLPQLLDTVYTLVDTLIAETPEIIILLTTALFMIINEMIKVFQDEDVQKRMMKAGVDLLLGLRDGFLNTLPDMLEGVTEVCENIVNTVKEIFGIHSPSRLFYGIGEFLDEGLANGITDSADVVDEAMESLATDMNTSISADVSAMPNNAYRSSGVASVSENNLYGLLSQYLPIIAEGGNTSVVLEGDAERMFDVVRKQNSIYKKSNGVSAFA